MESKQLNIPFGFIKGFGISYQGTISKIKKSASQLQPIYEGFTNALEAIKLLEQVDSVKGKVEVKLNLKKDLFSEIEHKFIFDSIEIKDTGKGFDDTEFERFVNLNDTSKGFYNKGSGRVQFMHFFEKTEYQSVFECPSSNTGFKKRCFVLSNGDAFIKNNSIVKYESLEDVEAENSSTVIIFKTLRNKDDVNYYNVLSDLELKQELVKHFLSYFCENRDSLPEVEFTKAIDGVVCASALKIEAKDIPTLDKEEPLTVNYIKISNDGKSIEQSENKENFTVKGFKIHKSDLDKNALFLTSKGELAKELKLEILSKDDNIDGNRYLFLLSGEYINNRASDNRDNLDIYTLDEFKKEGHLFKQEVVVLDDICDSVNEKIKSMYSEIVERNKEKDKNIDTLQSMFLLDSESIKDAKIKPNDTESEILEKVYKADAVRTAKKDAEIKKRIDALDSLDPTDKENFNRRFNSEVTELTKIIPLQNRMALTHYVARRKLVLTLFEKILSRDLLSQRGKDTVDESLIHNMLFQKGGSNPKDSDLWIMNEDFIYFSGLSEKRLETITINDEKILKQEFTQEEERYLKSLGENRLHKRPDVLLFPQEGKCIIIEFKAPDVNAAEHLNQIDFYANMILNYSNDKFQIKTFFGYLIGENIEARDVLGRVGRYEHSYQFDYIFRPSEPVKGFDGRSDGSIYTEVIKYSTLLERAKMRNQIFTDKLFNTDTIEDK